MEERDRSTCVDVLVACALAGVLATIWTLRDWANLQALRLPDADDMMRLQQIRDWLGGQDFADLTQYRLGERGVAMHWSRVADLVPAGLIFGFQGIIGRHQAELAAVILWPSALLASAIFLTGRIARLVGGAEVAAPAMVVAAIAYPASTVFVPGRIDHHGLQLVLLLVTLLVLVAPASRLRGLIAGSTITLSLVVGMELGPLLAIAAGIAIAEWTIGGRPERDRLMGLGTGLAATTLVAAFVFHTRAWDYPACDGFTAITTRAMLIAATVPIALALSGSGTSVRRRVVLALVGAVIFAPMLWAMTPQCLSPYGGVDSSLRELWLSRVAEAQPLFDAPPVVALGYAGLAGVGLLANGWLAWRTRSRGWIILILLQSGAALVTTAQLRGAYAGALLAAPALGAFIVAARRSGTVPLVGAWLASTGIFYPMAAEAMVPPETRTASSSCTAPDLISALGRLPPGMVMAPVDTGAPAIASTSQRLIAGAYHRDGEGNLAMYAFYRGSPSDARRIAATWNIRWVVACDGFGEVSAPFASQLERGIHPEWLREVAHVHSGARIFAAVGRPDTAPGPAGKSPRP